MSPRLASTVAFLAGAVALAGCGVVEDTRPDDFSGWQAKPLAPDRRLAETATMDEGCQSRSLPFIATQPPPLALPMRVELQDRRTSRTAAFVVATVGYIGGCFVSPVQTIAVGHLYETPLPALTGAIAVAGGGSGILGSGEVSYVWGQADARVSSVAIDLGGQLHDVDLDDRVVAASVGGGFWLGWWPDSAVATLITALDDHGNVVRILKAMDDGWVAE